VSFPKHFGYWRPSFTLTTRKLIFSWLVKSRLRIIVQ